MRFEQLLRRLKADYPELEFQVGRRFKYRPTRTIYYEQLCVNVELEQNEYILQLLHEVGHALAGHRDYETDVERVKMEREAWERARELCEKYRVYYDEEFAESEMDTYRDWLHQRSLCKSCGLTRYQLATGEYRCPRCDILLNGTKR